MIVHSREGAPAVVPNSLVKLDPGTGKVLDVIRVGRQPVAAAVVGDSVWVSNNEDATVTRVDVKTGHTETFGELRPSLDLVADGKGHVWFSTYFYEQVTRIDTQTLHKDIVPLGRKAFLLGIGAGSLWVTDAGQSWRSRNGGTDQPRDDKGRGQDSGGSLSGRLERAQFAISDRHPESARTHRHALRFVAVAEADPVTQGRTLFRRFSALRPRWMR